MLSPSRQPRAKFPLGTKSTEPSIVFSEAKLVRAIQTLDSTWKRTDEEKIDTPPLSDLLREAICSVLKIAACFDVPDLINKSELETVCTARVLGCLKRFVAGMPPSFGECCHRKCEQRLIHLALLSILFRMCRDPEVAGYVVREGLHRFLVKMCTASSMEDYDVSSSMDPKHDEAIHTQDFNPHDLMITVDPFDWCYQPLCTRLLKENNHAFFIPFGIQSLICLLRGIALPTDEVSEFELRIHVNGGTQKRRKLPSIFVFPLHGGNEVRASNKTSQYKLPSLCCNELSTRSEQRENIALWSLVLNDNSSIHLALRSLIALCIHLPRSSLEYRSLLREGNNIRHSLWKYSCLTPNYHKLENALSYLNAGTGLLLPFQLIAIQELTLTRIASTALPLFAEDESTNVVVIPIKQIPIGGRRVLSPISKKPKKRRDGEPLSLRQRLHAASEAAHSELTRWENQRTLRNRGSELVRNHQRLAIRKACADVENLRKHLIGSLEILCFGRQHPDPQQPFSAWIKSLPTIETLQLERQYQQEMRQRQILEQQYQREALRRREREECVLMQGNDYNIPEENELSIRQQKHQQFLCMQAEMRQLEQRDSNEDSPMLTTEADTKETTMKEKRANQERQRLFQLEDQQREGRELEKMSREDLYYVERIIRAKAKAKEEQKKREKSGDLKKNAIEEQQRHIARMRLLDEEKRLAERESSGMQLEDLLGRQIRLREAEKAKEELNNEWRERKAMQSEEHDCRSRWTLLERALIKQQQEELKQQRAEARRLKRQQQREEREVRAAWVESWDDNGNKYYYNSITEVSQWEVPDQF
ncbi:hypothetical protein F443_06397 [Phytophthora nicotianae P1569]|uniref:WW domain-containing protein n=1 Tax=Phytophthora nicotianae P1569 TaxID=1317065 RepID=V9FEU0_PHYNI|nr:hypothetical protein F443_06397 [Phytophthora nicotianae P1569]